MQQVATTGARSVLEHPQASYYRARYYDPVVGRFLGEDDFKFGSQAMNLYPYVGSSPTNATDPLGLCKVIVRYVKPWGWLPAKHAYIITVDPSGWTMGFRAGPDPDSPNIKGTAGAYDKYFPDFEPDAARDPENGKCNKVLDDDKPCTKINFLLMTALSNIDAGKIPYNWVGPNSNSVVPYALGFAGLPVPTPPSGAVGWDYDPFFNPLAHGTFSANPTGMQGLPRQFH
jgi:RHS repeat-associated protein